MCFESKIGWLTWWRLFAATWFVDMPTWLLASYTWFDCAFLCFKFYDARAWTAWLEEEGYSYSVLSWLFWEFSRAHWFYFCYIYSWAYRAYRACAFAWLLFDCPAFKLLEWKLFRTAISSDTDRVEEEKTSFYLTACFCFCFSNSCSSMRLRPTKIF